MYNPRKPQKFSTLKILGYTVNIGVFKLNILIANLL